VRQGWWLVGRQPFRDRAASAGPVPVPLPGSRNAVEPPSSDNAQAVYFAGSMRTLLTLAVAGLVAFAVITLYALEGHEVVVLRTTDDRGATRDTRVWIASEGDHAWIEAATPEREFYRDLLAHPEAELIRNEATARVRAEPVPGPEAHAHLRALLRAKYGLADWWVGLLQDTSRSVAVRIVTVP